jgi:hypothetical protein
MSCYRAGNFRRNLRFDESFVQTLARNINNGTQAILKLVQTTRGYELSGAVKEVS